MLLLTAYYAYSNVPCAPTSRLDSSLCHPRTSLWRGPVILHVDFRSTILFLPVSSLSVLVLLCCVTIGIYWSIAIQFVQYLIMVRQSVIPLDTLRERRQGRPDLSLRIRMSRRSAGWRGCVASVAQRFASCWIPAHNPSRSCIYS